MAGLGSQRVHRAGSVHTRPPGAWGPGSSSSSSHQCSDHLSVGGSSERAVHSPSGTLVGRSVGTVPKAGGYREGLPPGWTWLTESRPALRGRPRALPGQRECWSKRRRPTGHSRKDRTAQVRERSAPTEKAVAATPEMRRCSRQRPASVPTPAANSTCHVRPSVKLNTCCGPARRIGTANAPTDIAAGACRRRDGSPEPRVRGWPRRRSVLHQGFPGSCPFFPVCTCVLAQAVLPWPSVL